MIAHERYKEQFCSYCYRYVRVTGYQWKTVKSPDGSQRKQCPECQERKNIAIIIMRKDVEND